MRFIQLTKTDESLILVGEDHIISIVPTNEGSRLLILNQGDYLFVKEPFAEIRACLTH